MERRWDLIPELLPNIGRYLMHIILLIFDGPIPQRKHGSFSTWRKKSGLNGYSGSSIEVHWEIYFLDSHVVYIINMVLSQLLE